MKFTEQEKTRMAHLKNHYRQTIRKQDYRMSERIKNIYRAEFQMDINSPIPEDQDQKED